MRTTVVATTAAFLTLGLSAPVANQPVMSFFVTSETRNRGGDLGGLDGADGLCQDIGYRKGSGELAWHAYLSIPAKDGKPAVNARDRIGPGPWYNSKGALIATNVEELHSDQANLSKATLLDEDGSTVKTIGEVRVEHQILTGSKPDGTAFEPGEDTSCNGWTSSAAEGSAAYGNSDLTGEGDMAWSWNSAGRTKGCGKANLQATGGAGFLYCFGFMK